VLERFKKIGSYDSRGVMMVEGCLMCARTLQKNGSYDSRGMMMVEGCLMCARTLQKQFGDRSGQHIWKVVASMTKLENEKKMEGNTYGYSWVR
jgi:hypothetical protein